MKDRKISVKQGMAYPDALNYLEALVNSFRKGRIVVQKGEDFLNMTPSEMVDIKISAKQKRGREEISLELSWNAAAKQADPITISSTVPDSVTGEVDVDPAMPPATTGNTSPVVREEAKSPAPVQDKRLRKAEE
ncbi:MAG: amphi-Trp domain-containing protein [Desulfovibrio sp.]|nr:amphi-Trp domain-containing protein [Desulfovibrio sp.]